MMCSIPACESAAITRTWCIKHYARWKRWGDPLRVLPRGCHLGHEGKNTKKASVRVTTRALEWAAGFLEGEGCFAGANRCVRVSAVQVNKEPLNKLLALFGGALSLRQPKPTRHYINKPIWSWYISGSRARGVALTLYLLLSEKRQGQIRRAFA